jgi:thiosulfate/3-mercaptopyruvate sulfurtransferase
MSRLVASLSRRAFAAAVLASAAVAAIPAIAAADSTSKAEPLVTPQWLNQHRADADVVVLDIRSAIDGGGAEAYAKAHIPGAIHSDYDQAGWRVARNGHPMNVPSQTALEKLIGETGIDEDSRVVIVPAGVSATDFGAAARIYWTLKAAGHPALSILDGGFAGWQAAGLPVESGKNIPSPRIFSGKFNEKLLAELEQVEQHPNATLVDARPANQFIGKEKAGLAKAYGHIPHAINIDSASFYDPAANRLRPKAELAAIAGKVPSGPVVTYCNTGHWAATDWFVLSEVLGRPNVRLYAGSMVEWSADPKRPIESSRTRWDDVKKAIGMGL